MFADQLGRVPRLLRYTSVAVLGAGIFLIFFGGLRVGVTYDEPLHVQRFNNYVETGWYLGDGQVIEGEPVEGMRQQYVYAPVTMTLLHGLGVVTGVEDVGTASATEDAYAVRHLGIGMISLLGLWAVAATTRLILRGWDWGVLAAAVLVAVPLWTGHSMFNVKDVSVATGYALVTLGLALIARRERAARRLVRFGGPGTLAIGVILCLGTRPGMWTGVAAGCAVLIGYRCIRRTEQGLAATLREDGWRYRDIAVGLLLALAALVAVYPQVFGSPVTALVRSALSSANFFSVQAPWTFIPTRVAFQMPLLILTFVAIGTVVAGRSILVAGRQPDPQHQRLVLVFAQMVTLPLVAIVHGASLYGDLRQVLFAAPATAIVATLGVARLVTVVRDRAEKDRTGPPLVTAIACAAITLPFVDQALAFPYGYTAYNPMASVAGLSVLGDYYRASGREIVPELPVTGRIVCTPEEDENDRALRAAHLDGWVDCRDPASSPIAAFMGDRGARGGELAADEFWAVTFDIRGSVPKNCIEVSTVSRRLVFRRLNLASLSRCTLPFPKLAAETVVIDGDSDRGFQLPDLGWNAFGVDGTTDGVGFKGGPATMTFSFAPWLRDAPLMLRLTATREFDTTVRFGGVVVSSTWSDSGPPVLDIAVPVELVARAVRGPLTLELSPKVPNARGAKVLALAVEPAA